MSEAVARLTREAALTRRVAVRRAARTALRDAVEGSLGAGTLPENLERDLAQLATLDPSDLLVIARIIDFVTIAAVVAAKA